jgi:hypothetical protein
VLHGEVQWIEKENEKYTDKATQRKSEIKTHSSKQEMFT